MYRATFGELPALGVGLGFRRPYLADIFQHRESIDFLEIIADHYLGPSRKTEEELGLLAQHFTLLPHGLNLSIGSAEGIDAGYLQKMARLVRKIDPPWWSEHLGFTRAGGMHIGQFSPLPYTRAAIEVVCRNMDRVKRVIDAPLMLENITYMVSLPMAEMTEGDFLAEVVERTGCGILLDVTNLHINAINHRFGPQDYLGRLPLERIVQLHFAGVEAQDGLLIDSHAQPTGPEIWDLLQTVLARAPVRGMILERDENLPPVEGLLDELRRARDMGREAGRWQ